MFDHQNNLTLSTLDRWVPFIILILGITFYFPAFNKGYIWDDDYYVTNNPTLLDLNGLKKIWFELGATPQYYP